MFENLVFSGKALQYSDFYDKIKVQSQKQRKEIACMKHLFTAFIEHKHFQKSRPWSLVEQRFETPTISTPHYAETIEILVCHDIEGTAHIGGKRFDMSGKKVFFIAPQTVHSFEYQPCNGFVLAIKWHHEMLKEYVDIEKILEQHTMSVSSLEVEYQNFDDFYHHAIKLSNDTDISSALAAILSMLALFVASTTERDASKLSVESNARTVINEIIAWTEQNYGRKILLDEVALKFGYTKNYFCDLFKSKTGITYLQYLNHVRVSNACALLRTGKPVNQVSVLCGFETNSYFISLFKKTVGITPKTYQGT